MRGCLLFTATLALLIVPATTARAELFHLWSHAYGDSLHEYIGGIAVDTDGSIALSGYYEATADFGGGPLESAGSMDVFIARFNADGTHRWSKRFGDGASQICRAMAMASNGDVVITGSFGGTIDFGGGALVAADQTDLFVACFDRDGVHRWSKGFPHVQAQYGTGVAVDPEGNVVVTGAFYGGVDLGGGLLSNSGASDAFLVLYDANGNHQWSKRFGDGGVQEGSRVVVDAAGNVDLTGLFDHSIDLGGGALTSAGRFDVFLAQWDTAGNPRWSHAYGDARDQMPRDLASAPNGEIVIAGTFLGQIDLGGGSLIVDPLSTNAFLAVLHEDGTHRWSMALPGSMNGAVIQCVSSSDSGVLVGGEVRGSITIQGRGLSAFGDADALVLRFDPDGNLSDAMVQGRDYYESVAAIVPMADGDVILGGHHGGETNLGGGDLGFAGMMDIFVAAYSPRDPNYTPILAFSAILRGSIVEVRWHLAIADPSATYQLMRRADPDTLWIPLAGGTTDTSPEAYDDASVASGRGYSYRLAVDEDAGSFSSAITSVRIPAAVPALLQNVPNPFHGATAIRYSIGGEGPVVVGIYDASGRRVALLDQGVQQAGGYEVSWDGRDANGQAAASGVYFYRLEGTPAMGAKKMLLLR